MASSSFIQSAPLSSSRSCKYDVFLSFRGEDTRKTFVDHLYSSLKQSLLSIYKDDKTLLRGESIRPSLFEAIEESRIAIIIFSKHYADSSWCLDELAHIMKCKEERALIVMPIFYDVDPSDVRKQKGDFEIAFAQQEAQNKNKAQVWRNALVDASNLAGWEPKHIANGHESEIIKEIVDTIVHSLSPLNSEANEDLVGMTTRVQYLKSQLEIGSDGVRMVGIWGVGGGGKTTLASSLYMGISSYFEGHHIIENVREETSKDGLKKLQENILSAFSKTDVKVHSIDLGKNMIKSMLCRRKVLLVLDDVDDLSQLEALAGSHSWFGSGSRVLITTRDAHLLRTHKVDEVSHVRLLSDDEAMQLFNKHAYNKKDPVEDYETLSLRVISYAAGLPLALKVLGSFLYDKKKKGWMSTLDRLKDIPETEIVEKLKISYDGLKVVEKELFLDIACFFRKKEKDEVMERLEASGFHPEIGIEVLRQKALVSIVDGTLDMHDLVQEMGHYIVRGNYPNNPHKHSRIWKIEDINNMCLGDATMENDKIEAIVYHWREHNYDRERSFQVCKKVLNLKKLRYLKVRMAAPLAYVEGPTFLSNELRYIHCRGYPLRSPFPASFQPMKLVVLKLEKSFQKEVWKGCKHLPHLKVLELNRMDKLFRTPDFDGLSCLQKLTLFGCPKLEEIHQSLGSHKSLQHVNVRGCSKLRMFPTIVHMGNLKTLEIRNCYKIVEFPKIQENMEGLVKLSIYCTGIRVLPSSIGERCTNLISLNLFDFPNLKSIEFNFYALKHLKELRLDGLIRTRRQFLRSLPKLDLYTCHFKYAKIPSSITGLSNLQELSLESNDFSRLDFSLSHLTRLKLLDLSYCKKLLELPELPSSLTILKAEGCKSITTFGDCHKNCRWLCQVSLKEGSIISDGDKLLESMLEVCLAIENHYMVLKLTGAKIAKGFTPLLRGNKCTLQLPENWCNDYSGFLMCAIFSKDVYGGIYVTISKSDETDDMVSQNDVFWEVSDGNSVDKCSWVVYVSFGSLRQSVWWDQTYKALSFDTTREKCKGFGVRLVDKKRRSGIKETPTIYSSGYTPTLKIQHDSSSAKKGEVVSRVDPICSQKKS
ncbi:putative TIR domain, P-loop containing nucleoside triphosphate hydrolase [Helianthus annuus]|uniref:disease resistance protein RUN1-like n=1 Tax=Helianthus annuus TaxID=4232 RepID=UPI001652F111|nr:disease resistance protein RUN1-like [Helianthus annuus]KAJ0586396.1 putative TIR domain, P-loop containing nucleoside triphosphate hydrolase [Helianthus annuus]